MPENRPRLISFPIVDLAHPLYLSMKCKGRQEPGTRYEDARATTSWPSTARPPQPADENPKGRLGGGADVRCRFGHGRSHGHGFQSVIATVAATSEPPCQNEQGHCDSGRGQRPTAPLPMGARSD